MDWRVDLLAELIEALENWTPRRWWVRLIKRALINCILREIKDGF